MNQEEYRSLIEYRAQLVELSKSQINLFDKSTLALSTGSLGLSVLFVDKFTDFQKIVDVYFLTFSWVFLLVTILLNLTSYLSSWSENRKLADIIDDAIIKGDANKFYKSAKERKITRILNYTCLFTFIVGVILLAVFAFKNLERSYDGEVTKHTTPSSTAETTRSAKQP